MNAHLVNDVVCFSAIARGDFALRFNEEILVVFESDSGGSDIIKVYESRESAERAIRSYRGEAYIAN